MLCAHLLLSPLLLQEVCHLTGILGAELHNIPPLTNKDDIAVYGINECLGCCPEPLHLATFGEAPQMKQRQVRKLWEGYVARPVSQVGGQQL